MKTERAIKVLHVCTVPLTARTFIASLARHLSGRGYEVTIACADDRGPESGSTMAELRRDGFRMYAVPMARRINPLQDVLALWRLYRFIRKERFHIVHPQTAKAGFLGRCAARLAGVPVIIYTAHAFPFHDYVKGPRRWLYVALEKLVGRFTDLIMVDTEAVRSDGIRERVKEPSRILTVNMGIDLRRFSMEGIDPREVKQELGLPPEAPVMGTIARLVPEKGMDCFLRAAAAVVQALPQTRFLIIGDGPLRAELEGLAEELGIARSVTFTGRRRDIPRLLGVMDVFVLPTWREGFGVAVAEAMAMSKPVVVSRIPPLVEVVGEEGAGLLVPPGDHEQFAQAILTLLGDGPRRCALGLAGRRRVEERFDERGMFEKIEREYVKLLREKGIIGPEAAA